MTHTHKCAGGWLEYLTRCRLNEENEKFDQKEEMSKINYDAVDAAISSALEKAITGTHLHRDALTSIKKLVAAQMRDDLLSDSPDAIEQAVTKASDEWRQDEEKMMPAVKDLAGKLGFDITGDENKLAKTCGRAVALWRQAADRNGTAQDQEGQTEAVLSALEELVPDVLMTYAATDSTVRRELQVEVAKALCTHVISPLLRAQTPMRIKQACEEAIKHWTDLLKDIQEQLRPAENEQAHTQEVLAQAPALIGLDILAREQKSDAANQAIVQDCLALLRVAAAEDEVLNTTNLLKLAQEVASERKKAREHQESTEYIAKLVVRSFCVPAAIVKETGAISLKLSVAENVYLCQKSIDAVRQGKEKITVIVHNEVNLWIQKREQLIQLVKEKVVLHNQAGRVLELEPIVDSAIRAVVDGIDMRVAADKALRDARLCAAVRAAALSLHQSLSSKESAELIQELGDRNPTALDEEALRSQATDAISQLRSVSLAQEILEAIQRVTVDSPLSESELEDIRGRVAAAMDKGVSMERAVQDALPEQQNIWDTSQNSAMRRDGALKFAPMNSDKRNSLGIEPPAATVPVGTGQQRHVTLQLTVASGANMPTADGVGERSPLFCVIAWRRQEFQTTTVPATCALKWNEAFTFDPHMVRAPTHYEGESDVQDAPPPLKMQVFQDGAERELVGQAELPAELLAQVLSSLPYVRTAFHRMADMMLGAQSFVSRGRLYLLRRTGRLSATFLSQILKVSRCSPPTESPPPCRYI